LLAITDDRMIPSAAYTAPETHNAFQWARKPPKMHLPMGISTPIYAMHAMQCTVLWHISAVHNT